jgi:hypothetical protein
VLANWQVLRRSMLCRYQRQLWDDMEHLEAATSR